MSTTDPTGEGGGGGGGGGESATTTNVEQIASPSTPITTVPVQPAVQQQQQPQQHPPPSPLSGCYLLVVLPEPHTAQHKDLILNRLAKGFLSWDKDSCHVDLEKELLALVAQAPEGEEARNGERLIQYATENLVTEVLIHPQTNTLLQCIRNLLASFTKHRHIIHAGYTFGGNGSWILQDGTFSLADFLDAFSEHEVQRVLRAYENSVTVDIHCAGVGDWTTSRLSKETCCRSCRVRVNPDDVLTAGVPAITSFTNYIGQYLVPQTLDQLMESSDVVGNIRFSHPTLYVFPGGQGDAALFGINGFNMLVDGGFARKACFWDFTRHLDRLDAVLVTRINNSNIGGMFSVLRKKKEMHVYPQIGHFFCNLVERRQSNSPDGDKDIDPLVFNLTDIGQEMVVNLRHINLRAHPCYRDPEPINLYHKVGHGTLDMYVLSPNKDSREVREFLAKWHTSDSKLFAGSHKKDSNNLTFPIQNLVSICALLVWQPANPEDNITRILFPGSTPQHKIFEGFERLKHLDFLKHPVCSAKTLSPSVSLATLRDKPAKQKFSLLEREPKKISEPKKEKREPSEPKSIKAADETTAPKSTPQSTPIIPTSKPKIEIKTRKLVENKKLETEESKKESKKIEKELKEVKKEPKKEPAKVEKREDDVKRTDLIKSEPDKTKESKEPKEPKSKPEPKKKEPKESKVKVELKKSEVTPKPKLSEKKAKPSGSEKRDAVKSSPTTPKKTLNGVATKTEITKAVPKAKPASKVAPSLPAKSAKEANNRKVVEQKKSEVEKSTVKDTAAPAVKVSAKPKPMDRKPISRRAKPASPNKARMPGSPAKSTRSTPTASVKSDKDGVIRKVKGDKGTTDSSTVSTPSGIEPEAVKPIDKSLVEQSEDISLDSIESKVLADLKEEREVVEEIEAVLQKAERIGETRKEDRFEGDDEITAEATDKKEEDITEEDVTAEIEDAPKKEGSRKASQELTEEDEYLIVEKEEVYTEDSAQSGEGEQKHVLDEAQSEKAKTLKDVEEKGEKEEPEEKGKDDSPEKKVEKVADKEEKKVAELSSEHKEQLQEEVKEIIASAAEIVQKAEEKDDSGKKDSEDITKEPSSLSPDKLDSSEKKTTDTDMKPDVDQKEIILEKMEESQERISTVESGATTTAPTLPEDERIPLDEIKEDIDEKHVIEEVKEKDAPAKKEVVPETVPAAAKPEVKVFDVRQAMQNLQRDIVKTPDEVADLPVHEEVDPKLYRMEDFEKGKEEKPSPTAQESKEPPTPTAKEPKGVFSFFGKVADKFEKGIDKLTKKKKDSEKDSDEKSSSKSSSPKEPKAQEKALLGEVDMEKMFPKIGKAVDKPDTFEEAKPTMADVKVAAIKETAAFIQEEILDAQKQSVPDIEEQLPTDKLDEIKKVEDKIEESFLAKDILPAAVSPAKPDDIGLEEDVGEDVEEVKALLEEASKKFKTVKDSLRDSLESLDEKIKEEIAEVHETPSALKDAVQDTLEGVAEKLEGIKPHIESHLLDIKEPEKVKFDIPKDEEFENEYEEEIAAGPYRDMKEAVRDVGEVLAGTAGIELEDKPKDVIEIVKKVAEVLREDDLFSDKALFEQASKKEEITPISTERKPSKGEISPISTERKPSVPSEKLSPEKVATLEEKVLLEITPEDVTISKKSAQEPDTLVAQHEKMFGTFEIEEEPCIKVVKAKDDIVTSPVKDVTRDKRDAQKICEEMLKDDQHICDQHKKPTDDDTFRVDVMQAGIENVCVKKVAKRPSFEEKLEDEIEEPVIGFEQKVLPAKAEIVMVTPGSTPTSPKFVMDKLYGEGLEIGFREPPKLPEDIKQVLSREAPVEDVIEELIVTKKKKVTIEVIEYITIVKHIPRERVIYIIEEIIMKKGLPKESVVDDLEILKQEESITPEKRMEVEEYIINEYIIKGKRITVEVVEEISIKKIVPKKIIVEIIEEIIVKRKIARHMILDIPEQVLSEIFKEEAEESPEQSAEEQITPKIDATVKRDSVAEVAGVSVVEQELITPQKRIEIETFIVNEYVIKGKKITASTIDEISAQKTVPKQILIEIIEEIVIKRNIPRNVVLDVMEEELLATSKTAPEDEKKKSAVEAPSVETSKMEEPITLQKRAEVEEFIVNEYVTKGDNINIKKLEEICGKKKVSKRIIIEIIEEIIIKRKIPRHAILSVTEEELSRIKEEVIPESQILDEKRKSITEMPSSEEKKTPIELKEHVLEREISTEEELSALSEEEDVEEEEVDGFVSIPRRISDVADAKKKAIPEMPLTIAKEHEKDVIDDFEAVEQEYKVRDVPVTSPEKADEMKEKEDVEEAAEDTTSEVIEADEKFVQETKGKVGKEEPEIVKDIKSADKKRESEKSEILEIDTTEKYLDEAKEKTDDICLKETISKSTTPSPKAIDEKLGMKEIEPVAKKEVEEPQLETKDDKSKPTSPIKGETLKDFVHPSEKVAEGMKPETRIADATGFTQEPKVEPGDDKKSELLLTTGIKETPATKEEKSAQESSSKMDDGTVTRMLVTACSEDGREETEICPTGSITFTKTASPDDSLKDVSAKSTPDKDSLLLDKDSHSGVSTPEKDSISEKSAPEGKDKISPEDSLEKSPVGPRDSQDLEDSLEKPESHKPKVSDKIFEKDVPKSPKQEHEPKSPAEDVGEIKEIKSPAKEKIEKPSSPVEKIEKSRSPSPLEMKGDVQKPGLPLDVTMQKSPIESAEKPKLPIEKVLPEPKKEETISVPKTPESFHSEDASPAETIFSKSPTDKSEMSFAKAPITEEDIAVESVAEIKPIVDKELPISFEKSKELEDKIATDIKLQKSEEKEPVDKSKSASEKSEQDIKSLDKSPSVLSDTVDEKETDKPKSPSMIEKEMRSEKLPIFESEHYDEKGPIDEARSPSAISDKSDERKEAERSKSPSIAADKPDLQDVTERYFEKPKSPIFDRPDSPKAIDKTEESHDKDRSPSIASDKSDSKKVSDHSRSPSVSVEKIELKDVDLPVERTRSPSVASVKEDKLDPMISLQEQFSPGESKDVLKSPKLDEDKSDLKDVVQPPLDKSRSPSVTSGITEPKDRSKSPSIVGEKPDMKDVSETPIEKSRSSSITGEQKEPLDRSKSPSIAEEKPDLKDVTDRPDDKLRSPIAMSATSDLKGLEDRSKSPSSTDLTDITERSSIDKSKSPSIASITSDQKEPMEKAKSPTLPDKREERDRSKSPSVASEGAKSAISSKPSSVAGDVADLKDVLEPSADKSRSPSVVSATSDQKEPIDKPISPVIPHKVEESHDRSEKSDEKKSADGSRATGVTKEKPDLKDVMEQPVDKSRSSSVASEKADLFGKPTSPTVSDKLEPPVDRSKSPSVASDKSDAKVSPSFDLNKFLTDDQQRMYLDELKTSGVIGDLDFTDQIRSLSIINDKTEPKSSSDLSGSASSADDKHDQKDKSRSSSVASERLDDTDIKVSQIPEAKGEQSISPSLEAGKTPKDESAKSSRASSPVDKTPKDRSRSHSVFDAGEKTPASRSRTASLLEDKLPEKLFPQEDAFVSHLDMEKSLDEKDERKVEHKSPITSPETIEKKMQKIREKRFADFKEPDVGQPSKVEKSDDEEEDVVKVTAEKKAEIEKYILDEFIGRKRKISLTVIERLVMMYSVPQFIVMEIIEDIINRQNVPRSAVFDFVDDDTSFESQYGKERETTLLAPQERAELEEYIFEEFIAKKKKITPEVLEEMVIVKSVPRYVLITIIEEIIVKTKTPRNTVIEGDLEISGEKSLDSLEKKHEKPGATMRGESPDGKISPVGSDRHGRDSKAGLSASPSLSPEPIPSDKSTQDSPRSDPHLDEEILISEEKRVEIEKLLDEEYIKKGKKITEVILEEIIVKTSLPRYIILEIVEEIVLKRKIPRESVIDEEIYQEEEDYDKVVYRYEETADTDYELPHDARKSSVEYRMGMYPETGERQLEKPDYPSNYESQFHKAFVGGMTEMRTTHITTLSGKSTPEFAHDATSASGIESTSKAPGTSPGPTLTTTHTTDAKDTKDVQSAQTVTILRESKIAGTIDKDEPEETAGISATDKKVESQEIAKGVERPSTQQDEPEAITKIVKREIVEHDEPEVVTKVVKREITEQDEPEIITQVIRREILVSGEEMDDSKEDSSEYVKTITTRTTRMIVTEELPDAELTQTDPSKVYTDPTSGTSYKVLSDGGPSDATTSADVKRTVTTVTTITDSDGKVIAKKDIKESADTLASDELLENLTETTRPAEEIVKETITTVTSGTGITDIKAVYDSGKSTPDLKQEDKLESTVKERLDTDKFEHPVSPLIRELISDDKSYSGKSSPDISLPKDIVFSGKSTPEIPMSPLVRDGAVVQPHASGRSTPDRRFEGRSLTGTPEGFRSGEMIRTIVTTTKTVSDEGEIVTTTREVTETTNEKGETVVLAEKTDVKVDERLPSKDAAESAISSIIGSIKSSELQRSDSPGSDATSEKDRGPVSPLSEHSSVHSKAMTHPWGSSEERHTYSDDEPPSSPFSSQAGYSSQATRLYELASDKQEEQKQIEFSAAAMSSSFYGELPAVPSQISAMKTFHGETGMQTSTDPIHSRFTVEKEPAGDYGEKPDAKRYVDEADLDFDKALMEHKEMKEAGGAFSGGIAPRYTNGSLRHEATDEKDHPSSSVFRDDAKDDSKGDSKKDPLEGWGTPLDLPSPKPPKKFNLKNPAQSPSCSSGTTSDTLNFDVVKDWGEPLRLPSPAPVTNEVSNKGTPGTPKKERKQAKKVQSENIKNKKRSESPGKNEKKAKDSKNKVQPVYMDLAYVPHHGNSYYTSLEFFKRVRARYYVFSGTEPSREVYDALLEAKKTWEDKDLEVTMIPTYDTDTLGYWVADNEEALAANHIDLSPSASRCTINLQDHETSCSAYRLEF
ncbi:PREDICTED: microtubule-associated protein futsch [Vollenhovia emeryi]|uniref:microtubule-associated protein futsch n=1 Tax=Vollenhovia emeryi TaxID=411798 RepID=UPI0005F445E4|nr:PREDICTED: microtubule-associated protein futsch [Vollenhovia emeryi]